MKRTVYFPEIFEMIGNVETEEEKIAILHRFYQEKGFCDILFLCYDPRVEWIVTREEIENLRYDDMDIADYDLAPSTLFLEARRRLYNCTNIRQGGKTPLQKNKVIKYIARMFSSLYYKEVELFKQMVDGDIQDIGLNEDLVRKAFPGLLSPAIPRKPGRPSGAKNKATIEKEEKYGIPEKRPAGRPVGAKNKKKPAVKKKAATKRKAPAKTPVKKVEDVEKVADKPDTDGV